MTRPIRIPAAMRRRPVGQAAFASLLLGVSTIGCTPSTRIAGVAAPSADTPRAERATAKAHAALARHDALAAVRWAERAVAASPADADRRTLLGQAYLGAGRFASAEASFEDALSLSPDQPRARFGLALTEIARGAPDAARATLAAAKGRVLDSDLGLALALAGDRAAGIAMLGDVVRAGQSDARTRQNLALALALDGRWPEARGMAMQDTPPDLLEAKLAGWAAMAHQGAGAPQVAAMLGAAPDAADPGRPAALALAVPEKTAAPVALAAAEPVPAAAPTAVPVALMPAAPVVPVLLAATPIPAPAQAAETPRLVRAVAVRPAAPIAPGPLFRPAEGGGYVVQLGAYAHGGALALAWSRASQLSPHVASFTPVTASVLHGGATLMRLSIGGFAHRAEASLVCEQVRRHGGDCFVRAVTGDRRWQMADRADGRRAG